MLGRPGCWKPVWMNVIAGSWLIASVCIDLMTERSSTIFAVCGSSSLTHVPDLPCCANANIDGATGSDRLPHRLRQALAHADRVGHLRALILRELRLVVEQLELRRPAGLMQEDDPLRLRREVRQPASAAGLRIAALLHRRGHRGLAQQRAERRGADAPRRQAEELAAGQVKVEFALEDIDLISFGIRSLSEIRILL